MKKTISVSDLELVKEPVKEYECKWLGFGGEPQKFHSFKKGDCWISFYDEDGNKVYFENSNGYWYKSKYEDGNEVYNENSLGDWYKSKYEDGNEVYFENLNGYWYKSKYEKGKQVYYENSRGDWYKTEEGNKIEFKNGEYYLNDKLAKLK